MTSSPWSEPAGGKSAAGGGWLLTRQLPSSQVGGVYSEREGEKEDDIVRVL